MTTPAEPYAKVYIREGGGIRWITLDRAERSNAIDLEMAEDLLRLFTGKSDGDRYISVLAGSGPNFCSGIDVNDQRFESAGDLFARLLRAVESAEDVVISLVQGRAIGGGMQLALCSDIILAGTGATFSMPHVRIGRVPAQDLMQRLLRRLPVATVKELVLCGGEVPAERLYELGALRGIYTTSLEEECKKVCSELQAGGKEQIRLCKQRLVDLLADKSADVR